ncbi:MAG: serine hydrolase domain-containing protein [Gammaproteobacteria bacterium]
MRRLLHPLSTHAHLTLAALLISGCGVAATAQNHQWPQSDATAAGWDAAQLKTLTEKIAADEFRQITSVLVAHDGNIVFEHYASGADADTLHDVRSASKTITALLIGAALDRKLIDDVQARPFDFFKSRAPFKNPDPRKLEITLEDLLTMSSILDCNDDNPYSLGNEERMYVREDWIDFVLSVPIRGYAPWDLKPSDSPYGRSFSYCTAGSFLLGAVVEQVSGMTLGEFADQALFDAMQIDNKKWPISPLGVYQGGGGLRLASRDWLKLGEMIRNRGVWNGQQLLSAAWIEQATKDHVGVRDGVTYGYQMWRYAFGESDTANAHVAMAGNGGNYVFVHPTSKLVTVVTATAYNTNFMHDQAQKIYTDYVLKAHPDR